MKALNFKSLLNKALAGTPAKVVAANITATKKVLLIVLAILIFAFTMYLALKGVCLPWLVWLALTSPIGVIIVHLGGGKNLF